MDGFTIIDGIVAVVILLSAILAYSRGFVREALSIAGWLAAVVLGYMFAAAARPMVAQLPVINKFLADNCELGTIAGFFAVSALALVLFSILTPLFASVVQRSVLGGLDQGLGFLFGVIRGVILVAVALAVYERFLAADSVPMVDNSRSAQVFAKLTGSMDEEMPDDAPAWIVARYEALVDSCPKPASAVTPSTAPAEATPVPAN